MAHAIQLPGEQETLKSHPKLTLQKNGYTYTIERQGGRSMYTVSDGTSQLTLPIEYDFGAHMQTFVLQYQGKFYESLVSYYPRLDALNITLGDEQLRPANLVEAMGREMPDRETKICFGCHGTGAVGEGGVNLAKLKPGVTCTHCHVNADAHMQAAVAGKLTPLPPRLGQLDAEDMSQFCGQCHRTWEEIVRLREWGDVNVRFAPYRLANSQCFLGDDKRIRCTACHDPHAGLDRDAASYDRACLACHASKPRKSCPVSQNRCVSCHMPQVTLSDGHAVFTDHQIRIVHPGDGYPN